MDLEKELVSKILPYSEFRINLILESTTRIRNLKSNHRSFIPHLPIIRKIRVQILEKKFYNAIYLREKRFSMKRSFPFHFDRVNLIKNEKKWYCYFLKLHTLKLYFCVDHIWSYSLYFPPVSFSLPYYHERHAWSVKIRCEKIVKKKKEEEPCDEQSVSSMEHHRSHQQFVETEMNRYGGDWWLDWRQLNPGHRCWLTCSMPCSKCLNEYFVD